MAPTKISDGANGATACATAEGFEWRGPAPTPHPNIPLGQVLLGALRRHAGTTTKPAQVDALTGSSKTYPELLRDWVQAAAGWRSMGIGTQDTIAVFARNSHHSYAAMVGAVMEGITIATMVPTANAAEARLLLSRVTVRAMLCDPANLQVALEVLPEGAFLVVASEHTDVDDVLAVPELLRRGSAVDVDKYQAADVGDLREHVCCVVYSSGTTGLPKGVMVTNYGMTANLLLEDGWCVAPDDTVLVTSAVSWITGLSFLFVPVIVGATRVVYSYSNERECLDMLRKHKVTMLFIAPARYYQLADLARSLRAKGVALGLSLRTALSGGAAMSADLQRSCSEALGVAIAQAYGCTEHLLLTADTEGAPRHGSVGKLAAGVRAKLVNVQTGEVIRAANKEGELRVKSESYMKGYVGDPETTAKAVDEDGWYCTGDLARFDEQGRVTITDRIKAFSSAVKRVDISSQVIWDRLDTMYNMQALEGTETLPFPNDPEDFSLPPSQFGQLLAERKNVKMPPPRAPSPPPDTIKRDDPKENKKESGKETVVKKEVKEVAKKPEEKKANVRDIKKEVKEETKSNKRLSKEPVEIKKEKEPVKGKEGGKELRLPKRASIIRDDEDSSVSSTGSTKKSRDNSDTDDAASTPKRGPNSGANNQSANGKGKRQTRLSQTKVSDDSGSNKSISPLTVSSPATKRRRQV